MSTGYVLLRRGVFSPAAGSGEQSPPASGATITIWESAANTNSAYSGTRWKRLILNIYSSHDSAANGVEFEESADNTNWRDLTTYTYANSDGLTKYSIAVSAPFIRVKYTNSANTLTAWEMSLLGDTCERAS